jgi:NAD(P)-dependent dehydrogenase (short-subunit alcohol dehydrogenase family)
MIMALNQNVALVTGSSSGIGREISLILARNNFTTYATMRDLQKSSDLKSIAENERLPLRFVQLDITDENSVRSAIQTIYSESGKIDVLVNNAGYLLTGALEDRPC